MSRANARLVGLFVLGALALVVATVLVLGGRGLWKPLPRYVIHFDESVKGLRRGAVVAFRGVPVGSVESIAATYDPATNRARVSVIVAVDPAAITLDHESRDLEALRERGLAAQLQLESLLTGQLFVALDLWEPAPAATHEPGAYPEIPAVPSALAEIRRSIDDLAMTLPGTLARMDRLLERGELLLSDANIENAGALLAASRRLAEQLERHGQDLEAVLVQWRTTAARIEAVGTQLADRVDRRDRQLEAVLADVAATARSMREMSTQIARMVAENRDDVRAFTNTGLPLLTGLIEDADRMVNEFYATLRDVRQDPARFFFGDRISEGVRP